MVDLHSLISLLNFYPRSPCGERHSTAKRYSYPMRISIHALHAESDAKNSGVKELLEIFLSTLSMRRATYIPLGMIGDQKISIHALHAESDPAEDNKNKERNISIHALHAESDHIY